MFHSTVKGQSREGVFHFPVNQPTISSHQKSTNHKSTLISDQPAIGNQPKSWAIGFSRPTFNWPELHPSAGAASDLRPSTTTMNNHYHSPTSIDHIWSLQVCIDIPTVSWMLNRLEWATMICMVSAIQPFGLQENWQGTTVIDGKWTFLLVFSLQPNPKTNIHYYHYLTNHFIITHASGSLLTTR